jgi:hypothetical protein
MHLSIAISYIVTQYEKNGEHLLPIFISTQKTYSISFSSLPISEGLRMTLIPHASMISNLASAVSAPPEINAPA